MFNKKGDFTYPLYFIPSAVVLVLIILIFSGLFFQYGLAKNNELVIKQDYFSDSLTLRNILRTELKDNKTVSDVVSNLPDPSALGELKENLPVILNYIPKPEDSQSSWNFVVYDDKELIHLGDSALFSEILYNQTLAVPTKSKNIVFVSLYLECRGCKNE